jgi:predicted HTH transcriptional regulator
VRASRLRSSAQYRGRSGLLTDIGALANVRDGGVIIIGVRDDGFVRVGVDSEHLSTYKQDDMRDQLAEFADPHVEIKVSSPLGADGLQYVAIEVAPFRDLPVICRKEGADVHKGTVYYRNSNRRPESAAISNSYDMRDLILVAVSRTRDRLAQLGLEVASTEGQIDQYLDEELEGL